MNLFRVFRLWWKTVSFLNEFGPDLTESYVRDMPFPDEMEVAFRKWAQEGFYLLPLRYERILRQLIDAGCYTQAGHEKRASYITVIDQDVRYVFDSNGNEVDPSTLVSAYPWEDPVVAANITPALRKRIREYELDSDRFIAHTEAAIFWMYRLGLTFPSSV